MPNAFEKIAAGLNDAIDFAEGRADPAAFRVHVPPSVDVRGIRRKLGLSQRAFTERFGFSGAAIRDWEQGRRQPEASARVLLTVIDRRPDAVLEALANG